MCRNPFFSDGCHAKRVRTAIYNIPNVVVHEKSSQKI